MNVETLSHNKIKQINCLQQKKCRDKYGLFIVEGEKMVLEVLKTAPLLVEYIVSTADFINDVNRNVQMYQCDEETLKRCSFLKTPNKVIAVLKKMAYSISSPAFVIAIDSVQDPGNMGTIMRLADWFNVEKIVCSNTTVDFYNPKVVQASMGAFLRVQVEYTDLKTYFTSSKLPIYGALLEGENVYQKELKPVGILLMGNEGAGISDELKPFINAPITIPRRGNAESLNVSIATGILLSEFFRKEF